MRIYTAVFRKWYPGYAWFGRDSGLVTEGLRRIGAESRLVILDTPGMPEDERFLAVPREKFLDKEFWKSLQLDAVILQGGGEAGCEPVADAIKASGTKLLLRMDSDGVADPAVDLRLFTYGKWWGFGNVHRCRLRLSLWENHEGLGWWQVLMRNKEARRSAALFAASQVIKFGAVPGIIALKLLFPSCFGAVRLARRLAKGDAILVESRIAAARLQRLLHQLNHKDGSHGVVHLPIPVTPEWQYDGTPKENIILGVARWYDLQKDALKFVKALAGALPALPDFEGVMIGDGSNFVQSIINKHAASIAGRIRVLGRLDHLEIPDWAKRSKIFLCTSRGESMSISAAEASCSGCSVVGPAEIAAMHEYCSHKSGTLAWTRRASDFLDALVAEANEWAQGRRDPERISEAARRRLAPEAIAREIAGILVENDRQGR